MRQIKLRAWNWKDFDYIDLSNWISEYESRVLQENPVTQFTWLLDKNGKEIYENDIVKLVYIEDEWGWWTSKKPAQWKVIFNDFWWVKFDCRDCTQRTADSHWGNIYWTRDCAWVEVIWNIYENPDLLPN